MEINSIVKQRQQPLMESYISNPRKAWITDTAFIEGDNFKDPLHTSVFINGELKVNFPIGVHRAVGGYHDFPNSGDLLCASLASCFETTLRMIANRMHIVLEKTKVVATANVDVRGTLLVDKNVPVAFQNMGLNVSIKTVDAVEDEIIGKLIKASERSCIIFQTIQKGIPIELKINKWE